MLTSKQIAQNDHLTDEYGDGRDPKVGRIDSPPNHKPRTYANGIRAAASLVRDAGPADEGQQLLLKVLADSLLVVADSAERDEVRMSTGRIDYSPDYKSLDVKPPTSGTVRFCPRCGHNDRRSTLRDRHFVGGKLCGGVPIELEYVLVDPERARLRDAVVEVAKAEYEVERTADRGANTITRTDALIKLQPLMQKRREAVAALIEFESLQEKKD